MLCFIADCKKTSQIVATLRVAFDYGCEGWCLRVIFCWSDTPTKISSLSHKFKVEDIESSSKRLGVVGHPCVACCSFLADITQLGLQSLSYQPAAINSALYLILLLCLLLLCSSCPTLQFSSLLTSEHRHTSIWSSHSYRWSFVCLSIWLRKCKVGCADCPEQDHRFEIEATFCWTQQASGKVV